MNDLIPTFRLEGSILLDGQDLYGPDVDPVELRRRVGMVFQKPNPFPKSIYDNVAFGRADQRLSRATSTSSSSEPPAGRALGRGQGQAQADRACRCPAASSSACASPGRIATEPEVILMDEPCSALDPRATLQIEELMARAQGATTRSSSSPTTCSRRPARRDRTAFLTMGEDRAGYLVEQGRHDRHLHEPEEPADRGLRLGPVRMSRRSEAIR